jgi:hypothetical protein
VTGKPLLQLLITVGSHREFWINFESLHLHFWRFTVFPKTGTEFDPITESTSIWTATAFEGARNADEFSLDESARSVNYRIAVVSTDIRNVPILTTLEVSPFLSK